MTVADYIFGRGLEQAAGRLRRLEELGAPAVVLNAQRAAVEKWETRTAKVGGLETLGALELAGDPVWKKGRGGKPWARLETTGGALCYFPRAQFGPFVKREEA
jgi:hypothetical protein